VTIFLQVHPLLANMPCSNDKRSNSKIQISISNFLYIYFLKTGGDWGEKVLKSFANLEIMMSSTYMYRVRDTNIFLCSEAEGQGQVIGVEQKLNTVRQLHKAATEEPDNRGKKSKTEQVRDRDNFFFFWVGGGGGGYRVLRTICCHCWITRVREEMIWRGLVKTYPPMFCQTVS
jgi:hypothetical protein